MQCVSLGKNLPLAYQPTVGRTAVRWLALTVDATSRPRFLTAYSSKTMTCSTFVK
jgi:hypothetical protein